MRAVTILAILLMAHSDSNEEEIANNWRETVVKVR